MSLTPEQIREVVERTEIVRPPRQPLATFGASTITYYLVTEPAYQDLLPGAPPVIRSPSGNCIYRLREGIAQEYQKICLDASAGGEVRKL